jgi:hypothetical protein
VVVAHAAQAEAYPDTSGKGPAIPIIPGGGGPQGPGPAPESGPAAIISRLVRTHPEWDDSWSAAVARNIIVFGVSTEEAYGRELPVAVLRRAQTDIARYGALLQENDNPQRSRQDGPRSLIVHLLDDFGTAVIVKFGHVSEYHISIPNASEVLNRPRGDERARRALEDVMQTRIDPDLLDSVPIPIVSLPEPRWEALTWSSESSSWPPERGEASPATTQSVNVMRGDALEIDSLTFASVATCAEVDGVRGVITVEHAIRNAAQITHRKSGIGFSNPIVDGIWDAAWLPLPPGLSWEQRDGMPAPIRCERYREAPGRGLRCTFHGAATNYRSTFVDGSDPLLPHFSETEVARVYTARVTEPGDSGALLVDTDGRCIGMARSRTEDDYIVPMSLWAYFPGVLHALGAKL